MRPALAFALVVSTCLGSASARGFDESTEGAAREGAGFELPEGTDARWLPLVSQTTTVDVAGVVARIRLEQVWRNAGPAPLEASYVFPVSTRAALHDLRLRVGDERELRAEIRAKEEAARLFDAARDAGQTAGLLEQQRPNAVTLRVTNIAPGETIRVVIEASEVVRSTDGVYELVLPQTLGPRYAGNAGSEAFVENGHIAAAGSSVATRLDLTLRSPVGIRSVGSPSHAVAPRFPGRSEARIGVASGAGDVIADRDFVLRWKLAGEQTETGVLLFRDKERGEHFFLLLGEPPAKVDAEDAPPREVVFVVDVSGSMSGFPLETAKALVRDLVGELRPSDRFNMMFFSGGSTVLEPSGSVDANRSNVQRAMEALDTQRGGGGTGIIKAVRRALALPRGAADGVARARTIVVVTDGFISAERATFDLVREARDDAAVFAFGVGSSVNRHLIEGLAAAGGTEPFVVLDGAQAARAVSHFRAVSRPALTNVEVRFEGFAASDVEPPKAPDLYAGRPLVMLGRFSGASSGSVVVTGDGVGGRAYRDIIAIEDHLERPAHAPIRELWARERIARLADRARPTAAETEEVERLGLRYRLLTERTSFVVVDPQVRNPTGTREAVDQPSVAPRAVFGGGVLGSAGLGSGGNVDLGGRGKGSTRIVPGKVVYEGGLSRDEIQRVLTRVSAQLKHCYEKQLAHDPALAGKLVLSWVIQADGHVDDARIVSDTLSGETGLEVGACVVRVVSRLQFPAPRGGGVVNVTYPWVFSQGP